MKNPGIDEGLATDTQTLYQPITPERLEYNLKDLQRTNPEWFNYSDTLGERPIDGMMREIMLRYQHGVESAGKKKSDQNAQQQNFDQNRQVMPGEWNYDRQILDQNIPGTGKVF